MRVQYKGVETATSIIFNKYSRPIQQSNLVQLSKLAFYDIIQSVIEARGNAVIPTPNIFWSHGLLFLRLNQQLELTWLMLAQTIKGIGDFMDNYGYISCEILVLDDELGPVASGWLGSRDFVGLVGS